MKSLYRISAGIIFVGIFSLVLNSCGGGGNSSGGNTLPSVNAAIFSFPAGGAPANFRNAMVSVQDATGADVTTAAVVMNGVTLTYDNSRQEYEGNVTVPFGGNVNVSVTFGGVTYTASGTQFTSYPTISLPTGTTWNTNTTYPVTWSGGTPTTNAIYALGVLDATNPNGPLVWPSNNGLRAISIGTTVYYVSNITAGNRLVLVCIASAAPMSNTDSSSGLLIFGCNYASITVN